MYWMVTAGVTTMITLVTVGTCSLGAPEVQDFDAVAVPETSDDSAPAPKERLVLQQQSTVELSGDATVGAWDCVSDQVRGKIAPDADVNAIQAVFDRVQRSIEADEYPSDRSITMPDDYEFASYVRVTVRSFDCGNAKMERDMFAALKTEEHPTIEYRLTAVDTIEPMRINGEQDEEDATRPMATLRLATRGDLLLAGVTRQIEMDVIVERMNDGQWSILGRKQLNMTDFNVKPPTALFGFIRADKTVEVVFNLVVGKQDAAKP